MSNFDSHLLENKYALAYLFVEKHTFVGDFNVLFTFFNIKPIKTSLCQNLNDTCICFIVTVSATYSLVLTPKLWFDLYLFEISQL